MSESFPGTVMDLPEKTPWQAVSPGASRGRVEACGESRPKRTRPVELGESFPLQRQGTNGSTLTPKVSHQVYYSCPNVSVLHCQSGFNSPVDRLSSEGSFTVSGLCVWVWGVIFTLTGFGTDPSILTWSSDGDPPKVSGRGSLG